MRVQDLPKAKTIGTVAADLEEIMRVLNSEFPKGVEKPFLYASFIKTGKIACNFYAQDCLGHMIYLYVPIKTLREFAENLLRITRETYFYRKPPVDPRRVKGWEIQVAEQIQGVGIIVIPTWI